MSTIGIRFRTISDTSTAGSHLTVTLNDVASNGDPGRALCTLSDPASFTSNAVNTFDAPTTGTNRCPMLSASTPNFVVIDRVTVTSDISLKTTASTNEDTGGSAGLSIANDRKFFLSGSWDETASESYLIEVRASSARRRFGTPGL